MPFLAPPTEFIDSEITCTLVFYPSGDEYRRALFGNLAELTEAWNWETSRPDQLAIRQVWLNAYLQTLECNDMGCLDDILALLEQIRDKDVCCESVSSVPGGDEITGIDDSTLPPDIDRDEDEFPDGWTGGSATFDPYMCGQAHNLADTTDGAVDAVADTILIASNVVVFATLLVLAFGNVIGMGIAAILAGGYSLVTISEIFGFFSFFTELREALGAGDPAGLVAQTKSEMSAAHDDIVDAVACANDAATAIAAMDAVVDTYVTSGSYAALLKLTYRMALRPIFWGFGSAPDSYDCDCFACQTNHAFFGTKLSDTQIQSAETSEGAANPYQSTVMLMQHDGTIQCGPGVTLNNISATVGVDHNLKVTGAGEVTLYEGLRSGATFPYNDVVAIAQNTGNVAVGNPARTASFTATYTFDWGE